MIVSSAAHIQAIKSDTYTNNVGTVNDFLNNVLKSYVSEYNTPNNSNEFVAITNEPKLQLPNKCVIISIENFNLENKINICPSLDNDTEPKLSSFQKRYSTVIENTFKIVITFSTFKYLIVFILLIVVLSFLMYIFTIGTININNCPLEDNIPIYLLVLGISGLIRILLLLVCPFSYSKSIPKKIYKYVIKSLLVSRVKNSLKATEKFVKSNNKNSSINRDSIQSTESALICYKSVHKCPRISCFLIFLFNFCCCCCCLECCLFQPNCSCNKNLLKNEDEDFQYDENLSKLSHKKNMFQCSEFDNCPELNNFDQNLSFSNIKQMSSSANDTHLNETQSTATGFKSILTSLCCFNRESIKKEDTNLDTNYYLENNDGFYSSGIKVGSIHTNINQKYSLNRSASAYDFRNNKESGYFNEQSKSKSSIASTKTSYTYKNSSKKNSVPINSVSQYHLKKHFEKKVHKRYKLIDSKSVRYGLAHLVQRVLDLFILIWFVCGNYWIFSASFTNNTNLNSFIATYIPNFNRMSISDVDIARNLSFYLKKDLFENERDFFFNLHNTTSINSTNLTYQKTCNQLCFNIALFQIITTYSLLGICFLILIIYKIYEITCSSWINKKDLEKNVKLRRKKDKIDKRGSLPRSKSAPIIY